MELLKTIGLVFIFLFLSVGVFHLSGDLKRNQQILDMNKTITELEYNQTDLVIKDIDDQKIIQQTVSYAFRKQEEARILNDSLAYCEMNSANEKLVVEQLLKQVNELASYCTVK